MGKRIGSIVTRETIQHACLSNKEIPIIAHMYVYKTTFSVCHRESVVIKVGIGYIAQSG